MKASRFISIAAPERQRLAVPLHLVTLAGAIAMTMLAVFPAQSLERRLATDTAVDPVSIAYLHAWLRAKPDDYSLRLVLAKQEMKKGDLDSVESILQPLITAPDVEKQDRDEAQMLMLVEREQRLWKTPHDTPAYIAARDAYLVQLREVSARPWPDVHLQKFADTALALGDVTLGTELYMRLIKEDPAGSFGRADKIIAIDVANRKYKEAANLSFSMLPYTKGTDQRRDYFLGGLKILTSGNLLNDAVNASEGEIGGLEDDPQTLVYVVHLALAGRRPDVAAKFTSRLLKQHVEFGEGVG